MLAKFRGKQKDGMGKDGFWNVIMAFALIADMDETVIYAHLELVRRLVAVPLVFIKLFKTLKGCFTVRTSRPRQRSRGTHCSSTAALPTRQKNLADRVQNATQGDGSEHNVHDTL
jgi:hypothetical protein